MSNNLSMVCNHSTTGLFSYHVFCPHEMPLARWLYLALSLIVVFGLGRRISHGVRWAARSVDQRFRSKLLPMKDYPLIGREAFAFAKAQKIDEKKLDNPFKTKLQPTNPEINRLGSILFSILFLKLESAIKKYASTYQAWEQKEVLEAADACMRVAYTISCLTLEDLESFTKKTNEQGKNYSYITNLTRQDSYQCRALMIASAVYHVIRGAYVWDKKKKDLIDCKLIGKSIDSAYAQLFYTEETIQHTWNQLYNDYCDRVYMYVEKEMFTKADSSLVLWINHDRNPQSFCGTPGT